MKARRMAYWWFRFVVSGRFLEKFLRLRRPGSVAAATAGSRLIPSARRSLTPGDAEAQGMLRRNGGGVDSRAEGLGKRGGPG
jgi:hypothetical protein